MGNRFSFESDNDIVKLVVRLDANHPAELIQKLEKLPLFKSKQQLHGDILFFFSDSFNEFLEVITVLSILQANKMKKQGKNKINFLFF